MSYLTTQSAPRFPSPFSDDNKLNASWLLTADLEMKPFIKDQSWVKGITSIHSVFLPPILICKHRGLTHHCDFCLHYMLFWAEVSQDTMWLQPNLASHSVPELNHLCVCFKYSLMVLPQLLGFFSLFSVSCVISERILPFWISRNNPKLILTLADEVRLQW